MKFLLPLLLIPSLAFALPEVELIPEDRMGVRARVSTKKIEWNCAHEDWGKPVTVCRKVPRKHDFSPIEAIARELNMTPNLDWGWNPYGNPGDGTIAFEGPPQSHQYTFTNPKLDYISIGLRKEQGYQYDSDWLPILKGQPTRERAVETCREWMKKLRLDENEFARDPKGIAGFDVITTDLSVYTHRPDEKGELKKLTFTYGTHLLFSQRIGNYPAYYNGYGGAIRFVIADGGEMSNIRYCMHAWKPMGEYEILDRDEITVAIMDGFCWTQTNRIEADAIRIDGIHIEAYHALPEAPQKHFPLIYRLIVRGAHEPKTAEYDLIFVPALKIHRDAYGKPPLPPGDPR